MDASRFDRLAQAIGQRTTRRAALGLVAGLLGSGLGGTQARRKHGDARKDKKAKNTAGRAAGPAPLGAEATCAGPGPSSNLNGCNFSNRNLAGADLASSSMVGTNFANANLCAADLSSSQLRNADFRGANLTRADLSSSGCKNTQFNGATVFCRTTTCNGSIRNDDCPAGVPAGDACCFDADCGTGRACRGNVCCFTDVAAAVAAANPGDTIVICAGTYRTVEVNFAKDLTMVGAGSGAGGTTLDAEGAGPVLVIAPEANVEIRDLAITRGHTDYLGGGIQNSGTLRLLRVSVRDNIADNACGGIYNNGKLTLQAGTTVANNEGHRNGGGGVCNFPPGEVTVEANSRVENNRATEGGGGGVLNLSTMTLQSGSVVSGNIGFGVGGGVYNSQDGKLTVYGDVEDNETTGRGGGIYNGFGGVGYVPKVNLEAGSHVRGNKAGIASGGGGVYESFGDVVAADATIVTNNTAGGSQNNCGPAGAVPNCIG